jgi:hypothetical protein
MISLGCLENNNQLSSDFTSIGKDTVSQFNDSNLLVSYTCEQQKADLNLYNEYIIRGNITNTGHAIITNTTVSATFFGTNNYNSRFIIMMNPNIFCISGLIKRLILPFKRNMFSLQV